jgi:adenylate cyclase, class 2
MEEYEVKFLEIDRAAIENRLLEIGAVKVGDYFYRRRVFDYPDLRLDKDHSWIRLRDEGDKITLSFKKRLGVATSDGKSNDQGMQEIEVVVSDFEKTAEFFLAIGLKEKFYEENKRTRWRKGPVQFDIDTWPQIPTYLEIEADSWAGIDQGIRELGLKDADKKIFSTHQVYKLYGIEEKDYQRVAFDKMVKKT